MTPEADPARLVAAHREAVGFYRHHLLTADHARLYLARRGFAALALPDLPWHPGVDKAWQVGYAPAGWRHLTNHLTRLGYSVDELAAAGLARQAPYGRVYDSFRDRIMFPIRSADGDPVGFTGRTLQPDPRVPKYLNTPNTVIFHKGRIMYGAAEQADRLTAGAAPVLVEGPFDVIATWLAHPDRSGLPRAALAACGTNLSPHHVAAIIALPGARQHGITACYDPDPAGIAATERAWHLLHSNRDIPLRAAVLPEGCDPADLANQPGGLTALREGFTHRARPLLEAVIDHRLTDFIHRNADRPDSAELRVAAVHTVADLLTHVPPEHARRVVEHVATLTATSAEVVISAVIAAFDRDNGAPEPNPRAQSPPRPAIAAAFPAPSAQAPGAGAAGHPAHHTPTLRPPRRSGRR
jgi:DNA primase catalytic core